MTAFERIIVEVTQACQHACLHCYNYWSRDRGPVRAPDTLSRSEIRKLVRKVKRDAPLEQVALSGGEPLLRRDLPEIVGDLMDDGLGVVVITNGALLTDRRAARFPAGTIFELTLFATDAQLHDRIAGRRGAFGRVVAAAVHLRRHRCRFALAVVVNRLNAHDVRQTMELGIALGAEAILLNRVNLGRLTLPVADGLVPDLAQLAAALDAAQSVVRDYQAAVAVSVPMPPCVLDPAAYPDLHFGWCPRGGKEAYYTISHNGLLRPCNHASVVLGDLRRQGFAEIVDSEATRRFWAPVPAACRACVHPLAALCRGGCPAASHECYGTRERWDPIVDLLRPSATA